MILVPYRDFNKFVFYLFIQFLKRNTAGHFFGRGREAKLKSYELLITNILKNVAVFEKNIKELKRCDVVQYHNTLKIAVLPNTIISIHASVFSGFNFLHKVILPNSVKSIDFSSFSRCNSLEEITIPKDVIHISIRAFSDSYKLRKIILPKRFKNFLQMGVSYPISYDYY